jgi:hypothetical protein
LVLASMMRLPSSSYCCTNAKLGRRNRSVTRPPRQPCPASASLRVEASPQRPRE